MAYKIFTKKATRATSLLTQQQ